MAIVTLCWFQKSNANVMITQVLLYKAGTKNETCYNSHEVENCLQFKIQSCVKPLFLFRGKSVRSWCDGSSNQSFMVNPLSYFSSHPVLHDWFNKCRGMCYPVSEMMYIKEPLLLFRSSSPCGGSGFSLWLSEWSFTICLTPYNRK